MRIALYFSKAFANSASFSGAKCLIGKDAAIISRACSIDFICPSAMSWVFSSLHTSVGMAFVAAVIGEYLGSAEGVGYLILQAETTFDMNTVMAGILVLTACALILDRIVTEVEKRLMRWQPTV